MDMEDINLEQMQRNGQRHLDRGEWNRAQSLFENILEAEPENPCALDKLGVLYSRIGDLDVAQTYFVTVHGFRVQALWVHRKPACHPCPQYGRRASGRAEL